MSNTIFRFILITSFLTLLTAGCKESNLNFSHKNHLERNLECGSCHVQTESTVLPLLPDEKTCATCHEIDRNNPSNKCSLCHRGKEKKLKTQERKTYRDVEFSHKNHAERRFECSQCHQGVLKDRRTAIPDMDNCIKCHYKSGEKLECSKCHKHIRKDELPESHTLDWRRSHGKEITLKGSSPESERCYICHTQLSCDRCHKDEKPQDHTNQWRLRGHQVVARIDRDRCQACHRQDYCVRCHRDAPAIPNNSSHRPGRSCSLCHVRLQHSVTDETGCTRCHAN